MQEKELTIFLILVNVILLIFVGGIIAFIILYRQRRLQDKKDKELLQQIHKQELIETQLEVQKHTMRDIGREIHDNIGQKLTLASIYTQTLIGAETTAQTASQMKEIAKIIDTSLQDLRQISKSLVHPELAQKTLAELLEQEVLHINQLGICHVELTIKTDVSGFGVSIKNNLFRIIQEFIQNSIKHAQCRKIKISIEKNGDGIKFVLADDGIGFDMNNKATGIGLSNIKRRLQELQIFDYTFESKIKEGTTLFFEIK